MQDLQPWTFSSVGGSSGVRETHRGSFVNSGDPLPHPKMGAKGEGIEGGKKAKGHLRNLCEAVCVISTVSAVLKKTLGQPGGGGAHP